MVQTANHAQHEHPKENDLAPNVQCASLKKPQLRWGNHIPHHLHRDASLSDGGTVVPTPGRQACARAHRQTRALPGGETEGGPLKGPNNSSHKSPQTKPPTTRFARINASLS